MSLLQKLRGNFGLPAAIGCGAGLASIAYQAFINPSPAYTQTLSSQQSQDWPSFFNQLNAATSPQQAASLIYRKAAAGKAKPTIPDLKSFFEASRLQYSPTNPNPGQGVYLDMLSLLPAIESWGYLLGSQDNSIKPSDNDAIRKVTLAFISPSVARLAAILNGLTASPREEVYVYYDNAHRNYATNKTTGKTIPLPEGSFRQALESLNNALDYAIDLPPIGNADGSVSKEEEATFRSIEHPQLPGYPNPRIQGVANALRTNRIATKYFLKE